MITELYADLDNDDIYMSHYHEMYYQRNILGSFVIFLTILCFYLLTRTSSKRLSVTGSKSVTGADKSNKRDLDVDDSGGFDFDDVDTLMKNMRSVIKPKNDADRAQQNLSSSVYVEAVSSQIGVMMGNVRNAALGAQSSPHQREFVEGMFKLMDGASQTFMGKLEQTVVPDDISDAQDEVSVNKCVENGSIETMESNNE